MEFQISGRAVRANAPQVPGAGARACATTPVAPTVHRRVGASRWGRRVHARVLLLAIAAVAAVQAALRSAPVPNAGAARVGAPSSLLRGAAGPFLQFSDDGATVLTAGR